MLWIIYMSFLIKSIQAATQNLLLNQHILKINSSYVFMQSSPDGRIFAYQTNGLFHEYDFVAKKDTMFWINQSVWGSIKIFSNRRASLISQDKSKVCELNLQTKTISNCQITNSLNPIIFSDYIFIDLILSWVYCTNTTCKYNRYGSWSLLFSQSKRNINRVFHNYPNFIYLIDYIQIKSYNQIMKSKSSIHKNSKAISFMWIQAQILFFQDTTNIINAYNINLKKMLKIDLTLSGFKLMSIINGIDCLLFVYNLKIVEVLFNSSSSNYYPTNITAINIANNLIVPVYTSNINIAYSQTIDYTYLIYGCSHVEFYAPGGICQHLDCTANNCQTCDWDLSQCSSCKIGYVFNDYSVCVLNITESINPTNYTPLNSSNSTNTTDNSQNQTINSTQSDQFCPITYFFNETIQKCEPNPDFQMIRSLIDAQKKLNQVPTIRTTVKALSSLFIFFDDYWLYCYHLEQENKPLYSFFYEIFVFGNQKLLPPFIPEDKTSFISSHLSPFSNIHNMYTPDQINNMDGQSSYYLKKIAEMVEWNWQISFYFFVIFTVLKKFFEYLRDKTSSNSCLRSFLSKFVQYFYQNSLISMFFVSCFQSNIIYLCFYGFLQLRNGFTFKQIDIINFVATVLFIYLALVYSISFYMRIFRYQKKYLDIFLDEKEANLKGTVIHTIIVGIKNILEGILHAIFLGNIKYLMPSLILLKIFMIASCLICQKSFSSVLVFLFTISYFSVGVFMDTYIFYHKYIQRQYFNGEESELIHDKIQMSIPLTFISLILLKTLFVILYGVKQSISNAIQRIFNSNSQVRPTSFNQRKKIKVQLINEDSTKCQIEIKKHYEVKNTKEQFLKRFQKRRILNTQKRQGKFLRIQQNKLNELHKEIVDNGLKQNIAEKMRHFSDLNTAESFQGRLSNMIAKLVQKPPIRVSSIFSNFQFKKGIRNSKFSNDILNHDNLNDPSNNSKRQLQEKNNRNSLMTYDLRELVNKKMQNAIQQQHQPKSVDQQSKQQSEKFIEKHTRGNSIFGNLQIKKGIRNSKVSRILQKNEFSNGSEEKFESTSVRNSVIRSNLRQNVNKKIHNLVQDIPQSAQQSSIQQ